MTGSNLGEGLVHCITVPNSNPTIGQCSAPSGGGTCDPEGDACGLGTSARENCCGCDSPKQQCCKFDPLGVARCYGSDAACPKGYTGVAPCCIAANDVCTFSAECCDGALCLPDSGGILRCGATKTCVAQHGTCTTTADCCAPYSCIIAPGQPTGTCDTSGTCGGSQIGQSCDTSGTPSKTCCDPLLCENPVTLAACAASETDCICRSPIQ
jgi:hypothetical protein